MEAIPEDNKKDIRRYPPGSYRQVLALAYPVIIAMLSQTLMWLMDTVMVGRLGTAQLAAVGLAGSIMWTLFAFFNGLIGSANTFISQDYGAKQYDDIGKVMWHYLYIAIASSVVVLLVAVYGSGFIFGLIRRSEEVREYASVYARIRLYCGLAVFVSFAVAGFFRGIGNTKTPMYISIIANGLNVVFNYFLIFGKFGFPRLEVAGAALATAGSSIFGAILYLVVCFSKKYNMAYFTRSFYRLEFSQIRRIIRVGLPMGIQFFLDQASFTTFSLIIERMGEVPLAASNASIAIMSTSFMPLIGISIATTTLVGQFIGAKDLEHARKSGYTAIKIGMLYTLLVAFNYFVFPRQLVSLVTKEPEVRALGAKILMLVGIFQFSDGFGICARLDRQYGNGAELRRQRVQHFGQPIRAPDQRQHAAGLEQKSGSGNPA